MNDPMRYGNWGAYEGPSATPPPRTEPFDRAAWLESEIAQLERELSVKRRMRADLERR